MPVVMRVGKRRLFGILVLRSMIISIRNRQFIHRARGTSAGCIPFEIPGATAKPKLY